MKVSPWISIPGEGGDPCIAGTRPLRDYKTIFFLEMASFSLMVAGGHVFEDGGRTVHGHLPPVAGNGFPCHPPGMKNLPRHKLEKRPVSW